MTRRLIDISVKLQDDIISDPPGMGPKITYQHHKETAENFATFFPGLTPDDMPDREGYAIEFINLSTHNGTHLDAPYHFASTMSRGERAITVDEVPLEWCLAPGVKLDFRHFEDGYVATAKDVEAELRRIGHTLNPLDIVLVNTRAGKRYGEPDYLDSGCGMGRDATVWLLERGVRITGTDGWSWDAPFSFTRQAFEASRDPKLIWEGHRASREIGYCHLEKLSNLEVLPPNGFQVSCFPVKIKNASAGWCRAVAILDS
jgi:kynurenine formamidase